MSKAPKKLWRVKYQYIEVREVDIEADTQEEAERIVYAAEFDEEHSKLHTTENDYAEAVEIK